VITRRAEHVEKNQYIVIVTKLLLLVTNII